MLAIVLVHPEIPPNTGNVIRLCANTGCELHLIEPLGFRLDDRELKRAGLDYHEYARIDVHATWAECKLHLSEKRPQARFFAATTKAKQYAHAVAYQDADVLVFGSESAGLPPAILGEFDPSMRIRLPMRPQSRSLNLSNAVAIAVYEAWRQLGFSGSV